MLYNEKRIKFYSMMFVRVNSLMNHNMPFYYFQVIVLSLFVSPHPKKKKEKLKILKFVLIKIQNLFRLLTTTQICICTGVSNNLGRIRHSETIKTPYPLPLVYYANYTFCFLIFHFQPTITFQIFIKL